MSVNRDPYGNPLFQNGVYTPDLIITVPYQNPNSFFPETRSININQLIRDEVKKAMAEIKEGDGG